MSENAKRKIPKALKIAVICLTVFVAAFGAVATAFFGVGYFNQEPYRYFMNVVKAGESDVLNGGYYKVRGDESDCEEFIVSSEDFCDYMSGKKLKKTNSDVFEDYDYIRIITYCKDSEHVSAYIYPEIDCIYMENHGRAEYYKAELSDFGEFSKKFDYSVDPYNAVIDDFLECKEKGLSLQGIYDTYSDGELVSSEKITVSADIMYDFFDGKEKRISSGLPVGSAIRVTILYGGGYMIIYPKDNVIYILTQEPGPRTYSVDLSDFSKIEDCFVYDVK